MSEQELMNEMMQDAMKAPPAPQVEPSQGMLDTVKQNLNLQGVMDNVKHSKDKLFEAGLYAGIGFISGFLLKKYSTYVFVCVLLLVGLGVLQHLNVIDLIVNWDKVNELFGIQAATVTADSLISLVWEWMKVNMVISISYLVGLFIGLKVG